MNQQLYLTAIEEKPAAPEVSGEQIAAFICYLQGRDWTFRRQIEADTGWDERLVRALARAARPHVVSYPGSPGYKLWSRCTVAEIDRCIKGFRAIRVDAYESEMIFLKEYHSRGASVTNSNEV